MGHSRAARNARLQRSPDGGHAGTSLGSSCSSARGSRARSSAPSGIRFPVWFTTTMLALNITIGGAIVFTLLAVFASERRAALAALRVEQVKAENLLLNILPRSIAERLKAEDQPIADQFDSASILFADVVDFTPWSERLPPSEVVGYLDRLFTHFDTARRAARTREDQDDRRLLHGRSRRSHATARPCARAGPDGARHARGDALDATSSDTSASSFASASTLARSSPG